MAFDQERSGYWLDIPHFSFVLIGFEGEEVPPLEPKIRRAGIVLDHDGEIRYFADSMVLEVDVAQQLVDVDLLLPRTWIDEYIPRPHPVGASWSTATVGGVLYYVIPILASQTPTTQVVKELPWEVYDIGLDLASIEANITAGSPITLPVGPNENVTLPFTKVLQDRSAFHRLVDGTWSNKTGGYLLVNRDDANQTWGQLSVSDGTGLGVLCWVDRIAAFRTSVTGLPIIMTRPARCDADQEPPPPPPPPAQCSDGIDNDGDGKVDFPADRGCWGGSDNDETDPGPPPPAYPYTPPPMTSLRTVNPTAIMDPSFRAYWATEEDASLHVNSALSHMEPMYESYTGNHYPGRYIVSSPSITPGNGDNGCERLLDGFSKYLDNTGIRNHVDNTFHLLITARVSLMDVCNGAAYSNEESPGNFPTHGYLDSMNLGVDRESYKGGTVSTYLGMLIAQEVGHNWGEPEHVCQAVNGEVSIMCGGSDWTTRRFWLHYDDPAKPAGATDSRGRIISGTSGYD